MSQLIETREKIHIPKRFRNVIMNHIYKNIIVECDSSHRYKSPLILAISGPAGVGKSYQTEIILNAMGVKLYRMNGHEFESRYAGDPAKELVENYSKLANGIFDKMYNAAAILIDDADSVIGNWGTNVEYTVNRQLFIKTMLDIADHPSNYTKTTTVVRSNINPRIPIILTLNDETKLYKPLMRAGRTTLFKWIPTNDDIIPIILNIFPECDEDDARYIFDELSNYSTEIDNTRYNYGVPISIFQDIRSVIYDRYLLDNNIYSMSLDNIRSYISNKFNEDNFKIDYSKDMLIEIGKGILQKNNNYLGCD